jgi:murein DD-endopeptidase MepM/ murein hydrolase activator NlpD
LSGAAVLVVAGGAWIGCASHPKPTTVVVPAPLSPAEERKYLIGRQLMVPVEGVRPDQVKDTYLEPRAGGRTHRALDIMAPRGTPVLATDNGRVLRLRTGGDGGITIYAVDASDRFVFYYAHLDHYAASLAEGQDVVKGETIGFVGSTGNASEKYPHLHFQLMRRPNAARWWDGEPIDPKPYLVLPGHAVGGH